MLDKSVDSLQRVFEALVYLLPAAILVVQDQREWTERCLAESSTATRAAALDSQVPWLLQCMKQRMEFEILMIFYGM